MLKIQEIREIIELIDKSSIEKFSYEVENAKIVLEKGGSQQAVPVAVAPIEQPTTTVMTANTMQAAVEQNEAAPVVAAKDPSLHEIASPMVGTFYAASSPDQDAFVQVGSKVSGESIVCIVEAMKLFNEIEAEISGEIVEILAKDGQLVEYGQPLFLVKAN